MIDAHGSSSHSIRCVADRVDDAHRRQRVSHQQPGETRPVEAPTPAAIQPLQPDALHRLVEPAQRASVTGDPVV